MPSRISGVGDGAREVRTEGDVQSGSGSGSKAAVSEAGVVTATTKGPVFAQQQQQQQYQSRAVPVTMAVDKRSREYVLKSGLAGGLAGCAVCVFRTYCQWFFLFSKQVLEYC